MRVISEYLSCVALSLFVAAVLLEVYAQYTSLCLEVFDQSQISTHEG